MSNQEPKGPYVYQPYGALDHPGRAQVGRLFAVAGISPLVLIRGLTEREAECVCDALIALREREGLEWLAARKEARKGKGK